ncbi:adenosylcobinamide amidohydrolase [Streptomyces collinus]|uniref:adenosylcobinamide amidohydrolase n=1 Tax=Streptomyces collinus TaxID=42684 RepID=UPI00382E61B8
MISSAVLGGGIGERSRILNAQVSHGYRRSDPARHLAVLADEAGAQGDGVGLMTAADVRAYGSAYDARSPRPGDDVHAFTGPRSLWGPGWHGPVHAAVYTTAAPSCLTHRTGVVHLRRHTTGWLGPRRRASRGCGGAPAIGRVRPPASQPFRLRPSSCFTYRISIDSRRKSMEGRAWES